MREKGFVLFFFFFFYLLECSAVAQHTHGTYGTLKLHLPLLRARDRWVWTRLFDLHIIEHKKKTKCSQLKWNQGRRRNWVVVPHRVAPMGVVIARCCSVVHFGRPLRSSSIHGPFFLLFLCLLKNKNAVERRWSWLIGGCRTCRTCMDDVTLMHPSVGVSAAFFSHCSIHCWL